MSVSALNALTYISNQKALAARQQTPNATGFQMAGSSPNADFSRMGTNFQDIPLKSPDDIQAELEQKKLDENAIANILGLISKAGTQVPSLAVPLLLSAVSETKGILKALAAQQDAAGGVLPPDQRDMLTRVLQLQDMAIQALQTAVGGDISREELLGMAEMKPVAVGNFSIDFTALAGGPATPGMVGALPLEMPTASQAPQATPGQPQGEKMDGQPKATSSQSEALEKTDKQTQQKGQQAKSRIASEVTDLISQAQALLQQAAQNPGGGEIKQAIKLLGRAEAKSILVAAAGALQGDGGRAEASTNQQIQDLRQFAVQLGQNPANPNSIATAQEEITPLV